MNKMQHSSHGLRIALLAGVSVVALAAAAPSAGAADLNKPTLTKAPPLGPAPKDTWTWWIEGGAFNTGGGNFGQFPSIKPNWGGEGAVGFDWQPFAPMHVVGQFRYGQASKSGPTSSTFISGPTTIFNTGTQNLKEDHWLIDFGIGRDFGLGNTHAMWTLGVRVVDLRAKLNSNGTFLATSSGSPVSAGAFSTQEKSTFVGAGPRFGVQGDIPLGNQWSIDWAAGAAVLFGERTVTVTGTTFVNASDSPAIFNVDAQAGLSYWFTPNVKVTASYRFDEYFRALKNITVASTTLGVNGPQFVSSNLDRSFSGPMVRLTTKF
jgi:opacity protein-like surface antigen